MVADESNAVARNNVRDVEEDLRVFNVYVHETTNHGADLLQQRARACTAVGFDPDVSQPLDKRVAVGLGGHV